MRLSIVFLLALSSSAEAFMPAFSFGVKFISALKSSEEVFDGTLGQAPGTKNTYVIDGMDDMTPDEYQAALAQSVIERSNEQRYAGKSRGNRLAHDYMAHLSGNNSDPSINIFGAGNNKDAEEDNE